MTTRKRRPPDDLLNDIEQLRSALASSALCLAKVNDSLRTRMINDLTLPLGKETLEELRTTLENLANLHGQFVAVRSKIDFVMGLVGHAIRNVPKQKA